MDSDFQMTWRKNTVAKESVKIHNPKEICIDNHVHNSFGLVKCERKKIKKMQKVLKISCLNKISEKNPYR